MTVSVEELGCEPDDNAHALEKRIELAIVAGAVNHVPRHEE